MSDAAPNRDSARPAQTSPRSSYALRLNSKKPAKVMTGTCSECGAVYQAQRTTREFCSSSCRQVFNNRKATRGAAIYDLAMQWRADRSDKAALSLLCQLLAQFKDEDDRAGRRSWDHSGAVKARKPYLGATVVGIVACRGGRPNGGGA